MINKENQNEIVVPQTYWMHAILGNHTHKSVKRKIYAEIELSIPNGYLSSISYNSVPTVQKQYFRAFKTRKVFSYFWNSCEGCHCGNLKSHNF